MLCEIVENCVFGNESQICVIILYSEHQLSLELLRSYRGVEILTSDVCCQEGPNKGQHLEVVKRQIALDKISKVGGRTVNSTARVHTWEPVNKLSTGRKFTEETGMVALLWI